jgi:hypothetical protein
MSRVKIVGIRSGSTIVDSVITNSVPNNTNPINSSINTTEPTLDAIITGLSNAVQTGSLAQTLESIPGLGSGALQSTNFALYLLPTDESKPDKNDKTNIGLIVGVAIAGVVILCLGVLGFCHLLRRRAKISE